MVVDNGGCRPVDGWIDLVEDTNSVFHSRLDEIYGDNYDLKREAARMCRRTLEAFADDRRVTLSYPTGFARGIQSSVVIQGLDDHGVT